MTGREMTPIATTDAPTTPVAAARSAPTNTTAMASPPRMRPNNRPMVWSRSSARRDFSSIAPMKMKYGTASNSVFDMTSKMRSGMASRRCQLK